tara:strand:- start:13868 stop:16312 length:2445 start_codon:yes stop_codon:yes gene_type:complete
MILSQKNNQIFKNNYIDKIFNPIFIFLFFSIFFHLDKILFGKNALYKIHDTFDLFWTIQREISKKISSFEFPGWMPDYLGGLPYFLFDINWLSLPVILSAFFYDPWNYIIVSMFQFFMAGIGGYYFLKHFFNLPSFLCVIGGLTWSIGTFDLTYWRIQDLASIPLLFYACDRILLLDSLKKRIFFIGLLILISLNIQIARGAPFIALFHLFFIFASFNKKNPSIKIFIVYIFFWLLTFLFNFPLILTEFFYSFEGSRTLMDTYSQTYDNSFLKRIFLFFIYFLHDDSVIVGTVGTIGFISCLFFFNKWSQLSKISFYYLIVIVFFVMFVDKSYYFLQIRESLPLKEFRLERLILIGSFIKFFIFFENFDKIISILKKKNIFIIIFFIIFLSLIQIFWSFFKHPFPINFPENQFLGLYFLGVSIYTCIIYYILHSKKLNNINYYINFLFITVIFGFLFVNFSKTLDTKTPSFSHFFSSDDFNFLNSDDSFYRISFINSFPVVGVFNNYQVAGGYSPQYMKRYAQFWELLIHSDKFGDYLNTDIKRNFRNYNYKAYLIDSRYIKESNPPHKIKNLYFNFNLLSLNNVKYIFSRYEIDNPSIYKLELINKGVSPKRVEGEQFDPKTLFYRYLQVIKRYDAKKDYYIYRLNSFFPRIFSTNNFQIFKDIDDLNKALTTADDEFLKKNVLFNFKDLSEEQIYDLKNLKTNNHLIDENINLKIVHYSDDKIVINADLKFDTIVNLNENYSKDWQLTINNEIKDIIPGYGFMRSIVLNKGYNKIILKYNPSYIYQSLKYSFIFIFVLLILFFIFLRKVKSF